MRRITALFAVLLFLAGPVFGQGGSASVTQLPGSPFPESNLVSPDKHLSNPSARLGSPQFTAAPANDNCASAASITVNASCTSGTTLASTLQGSENLASCLSAFTSTVWYTFVATGTDMYVQIDVTSITGNFYTCYGSAVFSGSCFPSTSLSCKTGTAQEIHNLTGLTVGTTYYIQVAYNLGGSCGNSSTTDGVNFCIKVGKNLSCSTCAANCGGLCVFSTSPTYTQLESSCTAYAEAIGIGTTVTRCYTFTASNDSFNTNMGFHSSYAPTTCGVSTFNWTLQDNSCGATLKSGSLATTMTGLTVGSDYVVCYSWTPNGCSTDTTFPYIVSTSALNLPIELLTFRATYSMDHVNLDWTTASETNNNYFTLERSANSIKFDSIGKVNGAGNSTQILDYHFTDHSPLPGISYYRLKQTDYDGKYAYSRIVAVNSHGDDIINVFPNPASDKLNVNVNASSDEPLTVSLFDMLGKQVYHQGLTLSRGNNMLNMDLSGLGKGVYFLKMEYMGKSSVSKLMKE